MGDPLGPQEQWEDLTWKFTELCDRYHGQAAFYEIDAETLDLYTNLGMTFLKLGEEALVPLTRAEGILPAIRGQDGGPGGQLSFRVVPAEQVAGILDQLQHVSNAWLQAKNAREKGFSLGFFDPAYISQCPVAVVRQDEQLVAFANLWQGAGKRELSLDVLRYLPDGPEGMMDFLLVELMLWGRQEGYQWFNLGMAPPAGPENRDLVPLRSQAGNLIFRLGEHFDNSQGLRQYKEKFNPEWHPKYLACRGGLTLPRVLTNIANLISGRSGGIVKR
jgi:phosphatidylglycerol lysyltransferase